MRIPCILLAAIVLSATAAPAADTAGLLKSIKSIGREGVGNVEAAAAWKKLVELGPEALIDTLAAIDDGHDVSANYLRAAVQAVCERERAAGRALPADRLEAFVRDPKNAPSARRLAYDKLLEIDPAASARIIPGMLHDPAAELRRDAVAVVIKEADEQMARGDRSAALVTYARALSAARDRDQVMPVVKSLKGLGIHVDTAAQFGFLRQWVLVGPFDNTGKAGFPVAYPPESRVDLSARYEGKRGASVAWFEHVSADPDGVVDLNKAIGKHMGAVGYAFCTVNSATEREVQFRIGSLNAVKIFVNGKPVLIHEEYHHGFRWDQYVARAVLRAGKNDILLKVCQNEQTEDWAQSWMFAVRVCDAIGGAVPLTVVTEKPGPKTPAKKGS
jgi:hypothetical protein